MCQFELARVLGQVFEKLAKRLETCHCHEHVWAARMPYKTRAKKLTQETGAAKCVWKTRMGPWFAAVGLDEFLNSIQTCSSDMLQQLLDDVPAPVRAGLL